MGVLVDACGLCISLPQAGRMTALAVKLHVQQKIGMPCEDQLLLVRGRLVHDTQFLCDGEDEQSCLVQVRVRGAGGKGGFGSLLKGAGGGYGFASQSRMHFGACRDLQGRRIRHVENEQKLKDWSKEKHAREGELQEKIEQRKKRKYEHMFPPLDTTTTTKPKTQADTGEQLNKELDSTRTTVVEGVRKALEKQSAKPKASKKRSKIEDDDDDQDDELLDELLFDPLPVKEPATKKKPQSTAKSASTKTTDTTAVSS